MKKIQAQFDELYDYVKQNYKLRRVDNEDKKDFCR